MGYSMTQGNSVFTMKRQHHSVVLAAIKALAGGGPHQGRYSWVEEDFATRYDDLHDMMEEWRWELEYDDNGDVDAIQFIGEKIGNDKTLFDAIAPFVESGSFIEMVGEDGTKWKWVFDGMTCKEVNVIDTFEDDETVSETENLRLTALMNEFLGTAPEITVLLQEHVKQTVEAAGGSHGYILQLWTDFLTAKQ